MGALAGVMEAQYNVLRKHGHSPSEAFNETVEELTQSLIRLVDRNGMDWMNRAWNDWVIAFDSARQSGMLWFLGIQRLDSRALVLLLAVFLQWRMLAQDLRADMSAVVNLGESIMRRENPASHQPRIAAAGDAIALLGQYARESREAAPRAGPAQGAAAGLSGIQTFFSEALPALILLMFIVQSRASLFRAVEKKYGEKEVTNLQQTLLKIEGDILAYFSTKSLMSLGTAVFSAIVHNLTR